MSAFTLKILACLLMLADHIGLIFFPQNIFLRIIGRLCFPIFAFLVANGYVYTGNLKKYFLRLGGFFLISQIPYSLAIGSIFELNIFFTLFLGLLFIFIFDKTKHYLEQKKQDSRPYNFLIFFILAGLGLVLNLFLTFDYGIFGVLMILLFYIFRNNFRFLIIGQLSLNFFYFLSFLLILLYSNTYIGSFLFNSFRINEVTLIQFFGLLSLIFIGLYNKKRGGEFGFKYSRQLSKYFFYFFYPLHLTILVIIKKFL
ncbi:MAG: conjugal transfer protein TraX [Candidatus Moranbacteria bacterium]|nr:conjugal transfer protein TraX [Candidatus Moranbacteria bacterium]